jgi:hypothetical protein
MEGFTVCVAMERKAQHETALGKELGDNLTGSAPWRAQTMKGSIDDT